MLCSMVISVLTDWPGSLPDVPMIGAGVPVGVTVVVGNGHVIQSVVLRRERAWVRQAVGLVRDPVRWAESLGGAYGAGSLAGMNIWVQGTFSLKAILFGSEGEAKYFFMLIRLYSVKRVNFRIFYLLQERFEETKRLLWLHESGEMDMNRHWHSSLDVYITCTKNLSISCTVASNRKHIIKTVDYTLCCSKGVSTPSHTHNQSLNVCAHTSSFQGIRWIFVSLLLKINVARCVCVCVYA